ncbi:RAD52 family DNA repair protein [Phaeobacter italicus]|jgi:DNA recombination protein Rad52|uniref:RAD52 family DNA repair protein n=1 Tax=Phaeobacter italicus TaxID=481446 RepID=UPI002FDDCD5D
MNWQDVAKELAKPLSPDAIKPPPQGKYGEYVEALHVIREANRIFGFDGWSYDVRSINLTNATSDNGKHRVGYMAVVCVTIDGVNRTDVGHGQGFGKSEGDAHDSAVKEAVTDGLKRALRTFGNTFGLALYEKDLAAREVGYSLSQDQIDSATSALAKCETLKALQETYVDMYRRNKALAEHQDVVAAKDKRKAELEAAS